MRTKGYSNMANVTGYYIAMTQLPPWAWLVPLSRGLGWGGVLLDGAKLARGNILLGCRKKWGLLK